MSAASFAVAQTPPPATGAQDNQGVRIQGRTGNAAPPSDGFGAVLDLKDEMRGLVERIGTYARRQKPRFLVIAHGGLELLSKRNLDDDKEAPARTYMRSLDGLMVDGLFVGYPTYGQPTRDGVKELMAPLVTLARRNGLPIMTLDFTRDRKTIDAVLRSSAKNGFAPAVAPAPTDDISELPPYPRRPYNENPKSIISLTQVKNFAYISNSAAFGRSDEFALKLHNTNYDVLVVDVMHGRTPLSKRAVETLKYKKLGSRRLVFARMDIGTAASYHYYWKEGWGEGSPGWITAPLPGDPDRFFVEFWQGPWQNIITGNAQSYVFGIVNQGYDGVVLEGLNTFRFFEGGADSFAEALP